MTLFQDESSRDELSNNGIRLLQDMVEITTRDIMVGEHCSAIIEEIDNIQKQYFPVAEKYD
jgi:Mor family transcriptional regulator